MLKFPLSLGHVFGPSKLSLTHHDGRSRTDRMFLLQWQNAYRSRWNRPRALDATGVFDARTQKAVLEVQKRAGLPLTGVLDVHTWGALWTVEPPKPPPKRQPTPEHRHVSKRPGYERERLKRQQYWERFSRYRIGSDPDAPQWWPGRPFGPFERGDHVTLVQRWLGFAPTGKFQKNLMRKVRGLQKLHGLIPSGIVDGPTAGLLQRLYGQ